MLSFVDISAQVLIHLPSMLWWLIAWNYWRILCLSQEPGQISLSVYVTYSMYELYKITDAHKNLYLLTKVCLSAACVTVYLVWQYDF